MTSSKPAPLKKIGLTLDEFNLIKEVALRLEPEHAISPASVLSWNASRRQALETLENLCIIK